MKNADKQWTTFAEVCFQMSAFLVIDITPRRVAVSNAKQRCVMGVGMCLYAQLVQTKNK